MKIASIALLIILVVIVVSWLSEVLSKKQPIATSTNGDINSSYYLNNGRYTGIFN